MRGERSTPQNVSPKFLGTSAPGLKQAGPPPRLKHHAELPPVPRGVASRDRSPRSSVWPVRCERRQGVPPTRNENDQSSRPCLSVNEDRGQIKPAGGFRPFALRGIAQMQAEWQLVCLTHNLLKLWRAAPA